MKKLMKKKVNVFGKKLPVFVLVLLGIGLVSAALVPYLSNMITGSVIVASPMGMSTASEDYGGSHVTLTFDDTHGGAEINYKVYSKNLGLNDVETYPIMTIISANDWTGEEFTYVKFEDANYNDEGGLIGGPLPILDLLYVIEDDGYLVQFIKGAYTADNADGWVVGNPKELRLVFESGNLPITYTAGAEESWNELTVTTALNIAPDTYTIKLCHINDLVTGSCEETV